VEQTISELADALSRTCILQNSIIIPTQSSLTLQLNLQFSSLTPIHHYSKPTPTFQPSLEKEEEEQ
jgi:hypothetical protein